MSTAAFLVNLHAIGVLFLASVALNFSGVNLYGYRVFLHGKTFPGYYHLERALLIGFVAVSCLGFIFLTTVLRSAGEARFSLVGMGTLTLGSVLLVLTELRWVLQRHASSSSAEARWSNLVLWLAVALTFLGQATYGAALLQTSLLPFWAGWVAVVWNLGWGIPLCTFHARDPYFPVLFATVPLVVGILALRM